MNYLFSLGLFLVAGVGVWFTVTRTDYLPKLLFYVIKLVLPVILQRMSPDDEKKWHDIQASGGREEDIKEFHLQRMRDKRASKKVK